MPTHRSKDDGREKRNEARLAELRNHRVEIKFTGEPIYQFRVTDVSSQGAGLLINPNSRFLKSIAVDQIIDANFISPQGAQPSGMYQAQIKHITAMDTGRYKGLIQAGIKILERLDQTDGWAARRVSLKYKVDNQ